MGNSIAQRVINELGDGPKTPEEIASIILEDPIEINEVCLKLELAGKIIQVSGSPLTYKLVA